MYHHHTYIFKYFALNYLKTWKWCLIDVHKIFIGHVRMQLEMFKDVIRVYTTRTTIDCITFEQINYDRMFFFQLIWLKRKALFRECSPTYFLRKLISAKIREYKNKTKLRQTTFNKQALFTAVLKVCFFDGISKLSSKDTDNSPYFIKGMSKTFNFKRTFLSIKRISMEIHRTISGNNLSRTVSDVPCIEM